MEAAETVQRRTLPKVSKPQTFRDLGAVDCEKLAAMVAKISDATWQSEDGYKENKFNVLRHTRHIVLRFIPANRDPLAFYSEPAWATWKALIMPVMHQATGPYGFAEPEFPKVMLARLAAGHSIGRHSDGAGSHEFVHKIHVPLQTHADALFHVGDETRHLPAGRAVEVNNIAKHGVTNGSEHDRVHLIFEVFDGATVTDGPEGARNG